MGSSSSSNERDFWICFEEIGTEFLVFTNFEENNGGLKKKDEEKVGEFCWLNLVFVYARFDERSISEYRKGTKTQVRHAVFSSNH